jgi:hypothetical protein
MSTLLHDLRYALRQVHQSPTFSFAVVATLAPGIAFRWTYAQHKGALYRLIVRIDVV